jgi:hypothetical protein
MLPTNIRRRAYFTITLHPLPFIRCPGLPGTDEQDRHQQQDEETTGCSSAHHQQGNSSPVRKLLQRK